LANQGHFNSGEQTRKIVGALVLTALALSLLSSHAAVTACLIAAAYGGWCLADGSWRWAPRDNAAAAVNFTVILFAVGSAAICLIKGEPAGELEPYLSLLCAPLLGIGLRMLAIPPSSFGAACAVAATGGATVAMWQIFSSDEIRRASTGMGATSFGTLAAIYAVLCAAMVSWAARPGANKLVFLVGAVAGVVAAVLSGSRGALLILAAVLPVAVWTGMAPGKGRTVLAAGAVLAFAFFAAALAPNSPVRDRLEETLRIGDPLRANFFREAAAAFASAPLTGVPRDEFARTLDRAWLRVRPYEPHENPPRHAHNELLDAAAVRGFFGLVLNIAVLAVPVVVLWQLQRRENGKGPATTGLLFMAAYLLAGTSDLLLQLTARRMVFLFVLLYCVVAATAQDDGPDAGQRAAD